MGVRSLGITCAASVPITAVEVVDGIGVWIVTVDDVPRGWGMMFSTIFGVLDPAR